METTPELNPEIELLARCGLTNDQALMYKTLLKYGVLPASKASLKAGIKRSLGYKVIEQLVSMGLVEKIDKKVALFAPNHPAKLKEMVQNQVDSLKNIENTLSASLGTMISEYNMTIGKPNVRFFEGLDGVKKVLEDSLYSTEEILSYADITSIQKYIPKINEWYVEERKKRNITKRGVLLDTAEARKILESYNTQITDSKLIKLDTKPFESIMQIYDGKVTYITLSEKQMLGVIIEDTSIYAMHKSLFEFTWTSAKEI